MGEKILCLTLILAFQGSCENQANITPFWTQDGQLTSSTLVIFIDFLTLSCLEPMSDSKKSQNRFLIQFKN
jgi:hypothetical protein